jgi:hypothetical protein
MLAPTIEEIRADYAFLPAAADAITGNLLPWSSITEIKELYRVRPTLLPPSLAAMMHPEAVLEILLSPESSTLPLKIVAVEDGGAWQKGNIANTFHHLFQDAAFRTTVAALGRAKRREAALLKSMTEKNCGGCRLLPPRGISKAANQCCRFRAWARATTSWCGCQSAHIPSNAALCREE